jgi:hypothetical protein
MQYQTTRYADEHTMMSTADPRPKREAGGDQMSDPPRDAAAQARQDLHTSIAAWLRAHQTDVRRGRAAATVVTLAGDGDALICVRLNTIGKAKIASAVQSLDTMLSYCRRERLAPLALVLAVACGSAEYEDRPDLELIETLLEDTEASCVVWRDATAVSRSLECALRHLAAVEYAEAELHLVEPGGRYQPSNLVVAALGGMRL